MKLTSKQFLPTSGSWHNATNELPVSPEVTIAATATNQLTPSLNQKRKAEAWQIALNAELFPSEDARAAKRAKPNRPDLTTGVSLSTRPSEPQSHLATSPPDANQYATLSSERERTAFQFSQETLFQYWTYRKKSNFKFAQWAVVLYKIPAFSEIYRGAPELDLTSQETPDRFGGSRFQQRLRLLESKTNQHASAVRQASAFWIRLNCACQFAESIALEKNIDPKAKCHQIEIADISYVYALNKLAEFSEPRYEQDLMNGLLQLHAKKTILNAVPSAKKFANCLLDIAASSFANCSSITANAKKLNKSLQAFYEIQNEAGA